MDSSCGRISLMGTSILTPRQHALVEQSIRSKEITQWYYLTGGTALAEYYLHHRYSEDIDFFTRSPVNPEKIRAFIADLQKVMGFRKAPEKHISGLYQYELLFDDGEKLKIDFNEYDFPPVERGMSYHGLKIDSKYDIAVNKLYTITSRVKSRDFVDLYVLISQGEFSMEQLISRVPDKFGVTPTDMSFIRGFLAAQELTDFPTMLIPFDREKMIEFYLAEAKKMESKIFK